ncbi:MAG TPA: alcohol dehydrogenase catalytic domain-containing protein, partial [Mycobacterium sp.]|nr:alcohol dehydrogenase catalytic domain-containing protein [Mycobacterium sp.]
MKIRGAVLERIGLPQPYATSRPITVDELNLAPPGPGELLVRIEAAGLCHSDLSVVDGSRVRPVPMLLGHEAAGVVAAAGDTDLAAGQRVVMTFLPRCGRCPACATNGLTPCEPGSAANTAGTLLSGQRRLSRDGRPVHHHLGVSGFATHAVVDRRSVVPVDADVPPTVAALLGCAVLTGGGAVLNVGKPQPDQTVVVVGLGGVGMAAMLTALAHDDVSVIAVDQLPGKLQTARRRGARAAYTPQEAVDRGLKAAVVIEAAGHPAALQTAIDLTAPGGRTVT